MRIIPDSKTQHEQRDPQRVDLLAHAKLRHDLRRGTGICARAEGYHERAESDDHHDAPSHHGRVEHWVPRVGGDPCYDVRVVVCAGAGVGMMYDGGCEAYRVPDLTPYGDTVGCGGAVMCVGMGIDGVRCWLFVCHENTLNAAPKSIEVTVAMFVKLYRSMVFSSLSAKSAQQR